MRNWIKVGDPLGAGGQATVWLVKDLNNSQTPDETVLASLRALMGTMEQDKRPPMVERFSREIRKLVAYDYELGARKELKDPDEESKARLAREAEVYELIQDSHLLRILDKDLRSAWIVTEYHPNGTLDSRLKSYKGKVLLALQSIRPLVDVLSKMHKAGFVHRDFKPGNIFIDRHNGLVLGDAGLAFYSDSASARVTKTYENVGTRDYMPGWAYSRRQKEIKPTFDVFSVGKVLWALVAGEPTFHLWYFREDDIDLTKLFPSDESMYWLNWLLDKCVVEKEDQMQIFDAEQLGHEMDLVISAIQGRCLTPDRVRATRTTAARRRCSICGIGQCLPISNSSDIAPGYQLFGCNECDHVEYFWNTRKPDSAT